QSAVSYALALARLLSRLAPFLGRRCDPLNERVRFWVALDVRGELKAEIVGCQPAAKPFFDAGDAQVVIPAEAELVSPEFGLHHAVIANLDDIDAAVEAAMPRDLLRRKFVTSLPSHHRFVVTLPTLCPL